MKASKQASMSAYHSCYHLYDVSLCLHCTGLGNLLYQSVFFAVNL